MMCAPSVQRLEEQLASAVKIVHSVPHKLETYEHLLHPRRYNWGVQGRIQTAGHAQAVHILSDDGGPFIFGAMGEKAPYCCHL
jgi:hypothetical protein